MKDRVHVDVMNKEIAELMEQHNYFNFNSKTRKEQFMFALSVGVKSGLEGMKLNKKHEWFWTRDLKDEDIALIKAVAVSKTKDPEILNDEEAVFIESESYASLGFKLLSEMINNSSFDTFEKEFELSLYETAKDLESQEEH